MADARAIAEETARASYGRLLAWLSARTGDVAAAEDALADAFRAALENWPEKGLPNSPEAWILTTARRKLIDQARKNKTRVEAVSALLLAAEETEDEANSERSIPDKRLELMFACAHPAIDASVRTPLMLQTVLGLDAARIASAFLISPKAMSARLVRAKRKIKDARIPFETPAIEVLPERINAVLDSIYAAFGTGWNDFDGADEGSSDLAHEAIFLATLLTKLAPDEAEVWGLLALTLHAEARREARRHNDIYVPLEEQDVRKWGLSFIEKAEEALARAWSLKKPGRYQLEAAIQSAHANSRLTGRDVSEDVVLLYRRLLEIAPSLGAHVGFAAALANSGQYKQALNCLNLLDDAEITNYQPFWAVRAHILMSLGNTTKASACYDRAIGLASDASVRRFLQEKKRHLVVGN
ncbi:sigma factor [Hyphococcus flavus]|uniref:Sigma factor n=1 Tax=Hyphococcus flavus TaxID=1866326 RepID=A0AAF0CF53_9PROT|nr:DUF6596 domain-containing protein [Hyphococcus flavus]WDI31079.1 sigma factor [Hyphococcus flavus]